MLLFFTSVTKSTISCSVVSLVIKLSISVTTSTQMEQVRSFFGMQRQPMIKLDNRIIVAFIMIRYEYLANCLVLLTVFLFISVCFISVIIKIKNYGADQRKDKQMTP